MGYINNTCGIYKIINIITGDLYIGGTKSIERRRAQHSNHLKNNQHHSVNLQEAYNKYGEDSFDFYIIEECELEILKEREQYYMDLYKPLYNMSLISHNSLTETARINSLESSSKKVFKYDLNGKFLKSYSSISQAARENNIHIKCISSAVLRKSKYAKGFLWTDNYKDNIDTYVKPGNKKVVELKNGTIINEWDSVNDCAKALNHTYGYISKLISGKNVSKYYNLKFKKDV